MNTVTVATAAEPHMATTVINNTAVISAGVPTLVTNGLIGGGRTNLAGPQLEEAGGPVREEEPHLNLFNFSPDEHEPLLRKEQSPPESEALHPLTGRSSNSNNNNNRTGLRSQGKNQSTGGSEIGLGTSSKPGHNVAGLQVSGVAVMAAQHQRLLSGPVAQASDTCVQKAHTAAPILASSPKTHVVPTLDDSDPHSVRASQAQEPGTVTSVVISRVAAPTAEAAELQDTHLELCHEKQAKVRRPERPSSLDLSSSCISTG